MRVLRLLFPVLALSLLGMAERPPTISLRFHAEANARDGASFATPAKIGNPPRDAHLEKVPCVHERQIDAIYPFKAPDGSWGCAFKLDHDGRINLEVVSTERRGTCLVGFLATKKGGHQLPELMIDRTVRDGILSVPKGFTDMEIAVLAKQFKVLGSKDALPNMGKLPKETKAKKSWNPFAKKPAPEPMPAAPAFPNGPAADSVQGAPLPR